MVMVTHRIPFCKTPFLAGGGGGGVEEREDHTVIETGPLTVKGNSNSFSLTPYGELRLSTIKINHLYPKIRCKFIGCSFNPLPTPPRAQCKVYSFWG